MRARWHSWVFCALAGAAACGLGAPATAATAAATEAARAGGADMLPPPERLAGAPETLQSLLARTLEQDPQLLVARALESATREQRAQARSRLAPVLSATASQGRSKDKYFGQPVDGRIDESAVALRWNLFNGGADAAELRGSTQDLAAAREDVRRAREEIAERVALAYAELLRHEELLPASGQRIAEAQRLVGLVGRAAALGKLAPSDEHQARAALLDAQVAHGQLLADLRSARDRLAVLTGVPLRPLLAVQLSEAHLQADGSSAMAAELAAARLRAKAARERVLPWASTIAPTIDLEYSQKLRDQTTPVNNPEQVKNWQLNLRWDLPLGGANQARRAEVIARAEAAKAEADRVERTLESELATLPPRMANSRFAMAQLQDQIGQYDQLVRAGELQYQAGKRSLLQLVQLLDSRYVAQQRRAEEGYKLLTAQLRYLALRGDFLPALGLAQD